MKKPVVAIVKVENDDVEKAVRQAIDLLGGIKSILKNVKGVLLKPNLSLGLEDVVLRNKICTDPRVVEAVTKIVLEARKKVLIGDCSGANTIGGTRKAIIYSGFMHLKDLPNVSIRSLERNGFVVADVKGKLLKKINLSRDVSEAEAIINIPKMKTHGLTTLTGAIKNLFGTITGGDKTRIHSLATDAGQFSQCLVDLYKFLKPKIVLNVMDAIIAMEGLGPSVSGKAVKMNLILASFDAVALDKVAFQLMGYDDYSLVPPLRLAQEQKLGGSNPGAVEVVGEKIADQMRKFKLPATLPLIKFPFMKFSLIISFFAKIPKYKSGCVGCSTCVKSCPKRVIILKRNKKGAFNPLIDYQKCTSCFTCIELCPNGCYSTKGRYRDKIILSLVIGSLLLTCLILIIIFFVKFVENNAYLF